MYYVIIVDDEPKTCELLAKYIHTYHSEQYNVVSTFISVKSALEYVKAHPVHLVITDIKMPEIDGLEFIRLLKQINPICQVIIISGYNWFEYAKLALKYNVYNYILKPIDFTELNDSLTSILPRLNSSFFSDIDYANERTEIFFLDLFMNIIQPATFSKRLNELNLPFSPDDYNGSILKISLDEESISLWKYTKEQLENLFINLLQKISPDSKPYLITKHMLTFYIVFFYPKGSSPLIIESVVQEAKKMFSINIMIENIHSFTSLTECINTKKPLLDGILNLENIVSDKAIRHAIEYINQNFQNDITRDEIASAVYMSPGYFSYYFKQTTGVSPITYITNLRIEKAITLLTTTNMSVNKIAETVGYKTKNSFLLNFKKITGYTPTEYRKKGL